MTELKKSNIADEADKIYTNLCKLYGEYFNYVREQKGLSLRELSKQTNISIALISILEKGDKLPRIETLIRLTLALGIPFNEIFGRKAIGLEFSFNPEVTTKRDNELLRNTLLKMGCDKDDVKDILEYIEFKKYKKEMKTLISTTKESVKADLILNNGKHSDDFNAVKDLPLK